MSTLEKIHLFYWQGINKRGIKVKGELPGTHIEIVHSHLAQQGIEPITIYKKYKILFNIKKRVRSHDIALLIRNITTLLGSGLPLILTLEVCAQSQNKIGMYDLIHSIRQHVLSGKSLHSGFAKYPNYFNALFCSLIKLGEASGTLHEMLELISSYVEKIAFLKKKLKKALYYPATVLCTGTILFTILIIFILPQFEHLFHSFGSSLPLFTVCVLKCSKLIKDNFLLILLQLLACIFIFRFYITRSTSFKKYVDQFLLKTPILGALFSNIILARMARTLATALAAGLPLLEALQFIASITANTVYTEAILKVREDVACGHSINTAMHTAGIFPTRMIQILAVGEASGTIEKMLGKIAAFYEEEINITINNLTSLAEPFIIIFLSIIIGVFVVAMYLPIFRIGSLL